VRASWLWKVNRGSSMYPLSWFLDLNRLGRAVILQDGLEGGPLGLLAPADDGNAGRLLVTLAALEHLHLGELAVFDNGGCFRAGTRRSRGGVRRGKRGHPPKQR